MTSQIDYGPALMDPLGTNQTVLPSNWGWAQRVLQLSEMSSNDQYVLVYARPNSTTFVPAASPWLAAPAAEPYEPSDLLRRLKTQTDLSWDLLGRSLGVSRRTIYNWLDGAPVAPENRARLTILFRCLTEAVSDAATPAEAQARLLAPDSSGGTLLRTLARKAAEQAPETAGGEFSAADLLTKPRSVVSVQPTTPSRRPLRRRSGS